MAISKYTLYKYVKVDGTWRYCKAAYQGSGAARVFHVVKRRLLGPRALA